MPPTTTKNRMYSTVRPMATPAEMIAHFLALAEAAWAPAMSPAATRPLTLAAWMIETMPVGSQQNRVARMAQTRWLGTWVEALFMMKDLWVEELGK